MDALMGLAFDLSVGWIYKKFGNKGCTVVALIFAALVAMLVIIGIRSG